MVLARGVGGEQPQCALDAGARALHADRQHAPAPGPVLDGDRRPRTGRQGYGAVGLRAARDGAVRSRQPDADVQAGGVQLPLAGLLDRCGTVGGGDPQQLAGVHGGYVGALS